MASLGGAGGEGSGALLLEGEGVDTVVVEGMLDYKGAQAVGSKTGGWQSAAFITIVAVAERISFYGISVNLITYLTGPLHQATEVAVVNIDAWSGTVSMIPLLGAFIADSYLGRYQTILYSSVLYVLGLGLITLSALLPTLSSTHCQSIDKNNKNSCPPQQFQVILLFILLYIIAIAQGGHTPCTQAFGADQFNNQDPQESKSRSSFFNWFYFGLCLGCLFAFSVLMYIEDNVGWVLGFGISFISMVLALVVFLLGRKTYRYSVKVDKRNPFVQIGLVFVLAVKNRRSTLAPSFDIKEETTRTSHQFKFLDKALVSNILDNQDNSTKARLVCSCTVSQVNDAKTILRLVPIWCTCLICGTVGPQAITFFTKQGSTMDRSLGSSFQVPPASLLTFSSIAMAIFLPIYDRAIVPIARVVTKKPAGITMLQRIGFGMIVYMTIMLVAALVERKRLKTAFDFGLVDNMGAVIPMSIWWLVPQYFLIGIADAFTRIGLQEFFYDQVPKELKSLGIALYWTVFGIASFLSGFLVSIIGKVSRKAGGDSWFSSNLNRAHLDYFYFLLAGLIAVGFVVYLHFARLYVYNRENTTA